MRLSRRTKQNILFFLFRLAAYSTVAVLVLIITYMVVRGAGIVDWHFLSSYVAQRDITHGGIMPALVGTLYLGLGVALISVPVGISAAVFLNEYAPHTRLSRLIRMSIRNLAGVPSIVYGLFGLAIFVRFLGFKTSLLSAILTLSAMTLPWIITAAEESLKTVMFTYREAAYGLGATKWQVIKKVVIPQALPGMITGSILGLSRALGETAPIILVGATFYMRGLPDSVTDKFMALPYHLFILATQHSHEMARDYALGTAVVLIGVIFCVNIIAIIVRYRYRSKKYG